MEEKGGPLSLKKMSYKEAQDIAIAYCEALKAKNVPTFTSLDLMRDTGMKRTSATVILQSISKVRIHDVCLYSTDCLLRKYRKI